ncbi:carbohydrate-binding protein SusD [Chryseobacterium formosense]|uniref:Carbohydrate-binding protein SusD n=1 Tax=Chryseobacterium formosense TaxID=236814 RepID=A0A085Z679_9FLAO|nr:RagB/SusD family nutrient uptake outer membrane protein [Chryseobacterium formosense]KFE99942.1 carbohydrate-binding protein SusD [Chryseobacterium formosense]SFT60344.1 Starch-binding associating with outer membrane [Chryseobacterium formosense]
MKKSKSIFILSCLAGTLFFTNSCSDFLNPENLSSISEAQQFDSTADTFSALVGVYSQLGGDDGYGQRLSLIIPQSGDDFRTSGSYNCNDRRGVATFGACTTNTELNNPFGKLYTGIERANLVIKNIPLSPVYQTGSVDDKKLMDRYLGEALTLRAQYYYELIRNWGDVPFYLVPASDVAEQNQPKTDRDIIYDQLIEDLAKASTLVPWRSEGGTTSNRISKGFVKGLRARISLARAGWSLRRSPQQMMQGSNPQKYYQIAYDECKDIMNHTGEHALNPSYESVFRALHTNSQDATNEVIFAVGAFGGGTRTDSKIGYYNGLKHHDNSSWKGGGGINALPTYFYEFTKYDLRRDMNVGIFTVNASNQAELVAANSFTDSKYRKSWTNITGPSQTLAVDWPLLRLSDVMLMFAEADNEIHGAPSADAINAVKAVRNRAYAGNLGQVGTIPTDKVGFFNYIVKERMLELGSEGIRKYDLIRWNLLATKIAETKQKLTDFINGVGAYANVPLDIYYKTSAFDPTKTAQQNITTIDVFTNTGVAKADVFYVPSQSTTIPAGYKKIAWRSGVLPTYVNDPSAGYAQYFQANKRELLPIYFEFIQNNPALTQDYGY